MRQYTEIVKADIQGLKFIDGVSIVKEEEEQTKNIPQTITQVMDILWADTREKLRLEAEEKNKKPGPPGKKDDKAKPAPPAKPAEIKKADIAKAGTIGDLENTGGSQKSIDVGQKDEFNIPPDVKTPFRMKVNIRTLNNLPGVFFEELAEENEQGYVKKDTVMSCYWIEYSLSRMMLSRWKDSQYEGQTCVVC